MIPLQAAWVPYAASAAVCGALTVLAVVLLRPARHLAARRQLLADRDIGRPTPRDVLERAGRGVQQLMDRHRLGRRLDTRLEAAGAQLRPAEYLVGVSLAAGVAALVGGGLGGPVLAALLGGVVVTVARAMLTHLVQRRQQAIAEQLPDTLQILASSLRSGYGLLRAIDMLGDQAPEPTGQEFRRMLVEVRLGRDLDQALRAMARRIGLPDLEWVVQAIEIHREVGGDLAEVLDTVRHTVTEREQVRGQIRALTAQGRLSARILISLPVVMAGLLLMTRPEYMSELTRDPLGWAMIALGVGLTGVGMTWIHRLVRLVY